MVAGVAPASANSGSARRTTAETSYGHARAQSRAQEKRKLTVLRSEDSTAAIVDGVDAIFRFAVEHRRKGTSYHRRLRAYWLDSLRTLGMPSTVVLMVVTAVVGEAPNVGDRW
jgi:stalled ribosome alternative rescue factor ArfA